jgi:hypothetical protein
MEALTHNRQEKMSTYVEYSEVIVTDTVNSRTQPAPTREIKLIPRGSFAGTIYQAGLVKNPVSAYGIAIFASLFVSLPWPKGKVVLPAE